MTTPENPPPPSGWGEAPQPRYGQYGPQHGQGPVPGPEQAPPQYGPPQYGPPQQGQYGQGQYGPGQYGQGQYGQVQGSPYGPGPYTPSPKPGIVPLRPLTLGEVYDGAFGAIRHNPGVMLGAATLVVLVATVLGVLIGQLWVPAFSGLFDEAFTEVPGMSGMSATYAQLMGGAAGTAITSLLAMPVVEGILTVSVSQSVIGRKTSVRDVWERLRSRVWVLVGWSLLRGLAGVVVTAVYTFVAAFLVAALSQVSTGAAVLLALVFALGGLTLLVWFGVRLGLVAPSLALEGQRLWGTVPRAWRLTRGSFWRLLGIYVLAWFIVYIAANIVSYPLGMVAGVMMVGGTAGGNVGAVALTTLGSVVTSALVTIFLSAVVALLYVDVRMRREGLDVALTAASAEASGSQQPAPR